jgi:hypothetical protein
MRTTLCTIAFLLTTCGCAVSAPFPKGLYGYWKGHYKVFNDQTQVATGHSLRVFVPTTANKVLSEAVLTTKDKTTIKGIYRFLPTHKFSILTESYRVVGTWTATKSTLSLKGSIATTNGDPATYTAKFTLRPNKLTILATIQLGDTTLSTLYTESRPTEDTTNVNPTN